MAEPSPSADVVVVGAGILGLAVARELLRRRPGARVEVLEREDRVAAHQSSHNSGVVHAGIYYRPGSLKARLCVEGASLLEAFCAEHGLPFERAGKLVVARAAAELAALDQLEQRGRANGTPGLRRLGAEELREVEPHVRGAAALHSPATAIADFAAVAGALASEVERAGGRIATGCGVRRLAEERGGVRVHHERGESRAGHAIACAGAWSDRLARSSGAPAEPRILPFRGGYLRLRPERRGLVRGLVYPIADPRLPFLGVHLTRRVDGEVLVGPSALLVAARDAYRLSRVRPRDAAETLAWPGTYRLAARWWRTGAAELRLAASRRAFVAEAARYVPGLTLDDVQPAFAGIRAQAVSRDGLLLDDFAFSGTGRTLHVRNAPSPGATSSLAIAAEVLDRAADAFGWPRTGRL